MAVTMMRDPAAAAPARTARREVKLTQLKVNTALSLGARRSCSIGRRRVTSRLRKRATRLVVPKQRKRPDKE
jgi:hypothetical protein